MRVLVTVASKHGGTGEIAEAIRDSLVEAGMDADVRAPDDVADVDGYDAIVIGSAVYVGKWLDPAKRFVERHAEALRRRQVWLFSSGPLGGPPRPVEDPVDVAPIMQSIAARGHRAFAGELAKDRLGLGERAVVRVVRAPYGDFRDWSAIRGWAGEIAHQLMADASQPVR